MVTSLARLYSSNTSSLEVGSHRSVREGFAKEVQVGHMHHCTLLGRQRTNLSTINYLQTKSGCLKMLKDQTALCRQVTRRTQHDHSTYCSEGVSTSAESALVRSLRVELAQDSLEAKAPSEVDVSANLSSVQQGSTHRPHKLATLA